MSSGAGWGGKCPQCEEVSFRKLLEGMDRLYATTVTNFSVVECQSCGLMRLHPWPSPDELLTYYPASYWFAPGSSGASPLEERYRRFVLRDHVGFVKAALASAAPGPVLDVGCGGALFGRLLREDGHVCLGLDYSQQAAGVGWSYNGVPVALGDFASAPFRQCSFAAITMFHVLEHLYDPAAYLRAAHQCLRVDGQLVVQVPNAASWQFLLFREKWNGLDVPRHLINFRAADLERMLDQCGFEVVRRKHFSLRDNPAGLATSLAPGLDPMSRRVRRVQEADLSRLARDILYLGLVAGSIPFTWLEAACGAGSTIMLHARRKAA